MIRAALDTDLLKFAPENEALLRILAAAELYGTEQPFCRFMVGENSVFSVMDGTATVYFGDDTDADEIMLYLTMSPDIRTVRTDAAHAAALAMRWGVGYRSGAVMRAEGDISPLGAAELCAPAAVYPVLNKVFSGDLPPFDVWYADVHHRYRHGRFCAAAVCVGEQTVACAMTTAECENAVLIGGVATLLQYRGKGFASACVTTVAAAHRGRAVWISPKNDAAQKLYEKLGFAVVGQWGILQKP